ncbi:MAG: H+transporting two-sector ATPase subunit [Lachnospiraceae bacterium]|jgi:V/A-type H+-transporting ATPase subunit C|nr:H+transporting two-sector ATPase subunit [Lachnospiraceae bacterium]
MNSLLSYSGIITKIKAMEKSFITNDDYQKIANLESVAAFTAFLKSHPGYEQIFNGVDEYIIHRGQIEGYFINGLYLDYAKIYRFADIEQRKTLDLTFFRYEINILKTCIQMIYSEKEDYDLSAFNLFFEKHSNINVSALASSKSMEEYIGYLKGTEYYSMFVRMQNTSGITSFDYEMMLDIYYFRKMWKLKDKLLSGDNLKALTHSLGSEIDLLNILWLYRSKKFYDIHPQNAFSYIIPISYKLKKEQLSKLLDAVTIDEFVNNLKHTHYSNIIPSLLDGTMEIAYQKILTKINQLNASKYPNSMAPVNFYLYKKQLEIKRLTTALECIRYKLEPQDILKYVLQ